MERIKFRGTRTGLSHLKFSIHQGFLFNSDVSKGYFLKFIKLGSFPTNYLKHSHPNVISWLLGKNLG